MRSSRLVNAHGLDVLRSTLSSFWRNRIYDSLNPDGAVTHEQVCDLVR
jgi:hypothetical protein